MKRVTRRTLLKLAQVSAAASVAGTLELGDGPHPKGTRKQGTCRMCTMHCGIIGTVEGDRLTRVEGDPESKTRGFLCHHGWALREVLHSPDRCQAPLRRTGISTREATWDQALDEIAARLITVRDRFGPEAVAVQMGWPFVRHPLVPLLQRFCTAFGTPNLATVASLCESAGRMGKALVAGADLEPDLKEARTVLVWGANPHVTSPPFAHLIAQKAHDGHRLIVVDPHRTELAREASLHLRPRPGTDGALAMGLLHCAITEGLYDAQRVARDMVGFDELTRAAANYPADVVESITGVSPLQLREAARLFAQGPGTVWDGLGLEHHVSGVQAIRAVTSLAAILGYVDVPGGLRLKVRPEAGFADRPLPQLFNLSTPEPVPPSPKARPIGYDEFPLFHVYNRQAQGMLFPDAILEDRPYPLRALICLGSNPAITHPDTTRMRRALERLDLLVVIDPFPSATAALAHWVLPAATFAETAETSPKERGEVHRESLVRPQHQSWPDAQIVFELARRLGLGDFFPWQTLAEAVAAPRFPYLADPARTPRPELPAGAAAPRYPTPSGKIELASGLAERYGAPRVPDWTAAPAVPSAGFPLYLVTGPRGRRFINSQFRTIPSLRIRTPRPLIEIHPITAARYGVAAGNRVRVTSPHGALEMEALLSALVHPECVVVPAGWDSVSANLLTVADELDPISGFPAFRSGVARIERWSSGA